jgi:hypothetical protein
MDDFKLEGTADTPSIHFSQSAGTMKISGRSLPEDAFSFYQPVIEWLNKYLTTPASQTSFTFDLEYFNTASAKQIFKLMSIVSELAKKKSTTVNWHYDKGDRDMKSSGERFSKLCELPLNLVENAQ